MKKSHQIPSVDLKNFVPSAFPLHANFAEYKNMKDTEFATLDIQEKIIQSIADNPDYFSSEGYGSDIDASMNIIKPYLFLPVEEESLFHDAVTNTNREYLKVYYPHVLESISQRYLNNITHPDCNHAIAVELQTRFNINDYIKVLRKVMATSYLFNKYQYDMIGLVLSRRASRTSEKKKENIRKYYRNYAKHRILMGRKQTFIQGYRNIPKTITSHTLVSALSIDFPMQADGKNNNIQPSSGILLPMKKKPASKRKEVTPTLPYPEECKNNTHLDTPESNPDGRKFVITDWPVGHWIKKIV